MRAPADRRAAFLSTVPASQRSTFERAFAGKSRAAAIRAKCLDCCHFSRAEVAACAVIACPLHPVRPFRESGIGPGCEESPESMQEGAPDASTEKNGHGVRGRYAPAPQNAGNRVSGQGGEE